MLQWVEVPMVHYHISQFVRGSWQEAATVDRGQPSAVGNTGRIIQAPTVLEHKAGLSRKCRSLQRPDTRTDRRRASTLPGHHLTISSAAFLAGKVERRMSQEGHDLLEALRRANQQVRFKLIKEVSSLTQFDNHKWGKAVPPDTQQTQSDRRPATRHPSAILEYKTPVALYLHHHFLCKHSAFF